MATIFQCHYMRSSIFYIQEFIHPTKKEEKYLYFKQQFSHIDMDKRTFYTYLARFHKFLAKKKYSTSMKKKVMSHFTLEKWNNPDENYKHLHTLFSCGPCKHINLPNSSENL
eukprot:TCONS_00044333-protein